ncbi:MAG: hypothetical protein ABIH26_03745 [Candidatus Eisenbacteria bacterium]
MNGGPSVLSPPPSSHRFVTRGVFSCLVAAILLASPSEPAAEERSSGDALLRLRVESAEELRAFLDEWEGRGARFPHVYPPDILIGDVPKNLETDLRGDRRVRALFRKPADLGSCADDPRLVRIASSWNRERAFGPPPEGAEALPALPSLALPPYSPPEHAKNHEGKDGPLAAYGRAHGAGYYQTSEIFMGRIAVGVILPDSPGAVYEEHEIEAVLDAVRGAMDFWVREISYVGVQFHYDIRSHVSCSKDFIASQPRYLDAEWIGEILANIGYEGSGGDAAELIYPYVNDLRTEFGAEWGICFFIPKVPSFNANYLTYGKTGGPYSVLPAGSQRQGNRWVAGKAWLSHLVIRETARLFWALNEYRQGDGALYCNNRSGYLGTLNLNSRNQDHMCLGAPIVPCCMDTTDAVVCRHTLAHMGLKNSDRDDIPDVFDTTPLIELEPFSDTITTVCPTISGRARVDPLHNYAGNGTRNSITFNTVEHIDYRIDQARDSLGQELWIRADPPEGWGDSTSVGFAFVPDSLLAGKHRVTVRAVNTAGNASDYLGEGVIDVYVRAVAIHDFRAEPDYDGVVRIAFRVRGKTLGAEASLYRRSGSGEEALLHSFVLQENGNHSLFDVGATPGEETTYRLEASVDELSWSYETKILGPSPIERGEHLSRASPNPFRDVTVISYLVPRGDPVEQTPHDHDQDEIPTPGGAEGAPLLSAAAAATRYKQVRVEIDIFTPAGRLVRSFPHIHSYEGIYIDPVLWDGCDDSGRRLPAGIYLVRMKAGGVRETRKVVLLP